MFVRMAAMDIENQEFEWFMFFSINRFINNMGCRDAKLKTFSTHIFY